MGEGVEALLVGAVLAHVTFLTTLAIAHWFRAVGDLMAFLPYCTSGTRLVRGSQQFGDLPLSSYSSLSTSLAPGSHPVIMKVNIANLRTLHLDVAILATKAAHLRFRAVRCHVPLHTEEI